MEHMEGCGVGEVLQHVLDGKDQHLGEDVHTCFVNVGQ